MSAVIMTLKEAARFMEATKGLEGDDVLMWWRENHKYRAALRQALENYEKSKAYAAEHAEEILEADANGA